MKAKKVLRFSLVILLALTVSLEAKVVTLDQFIKQLKTHPLFEKGRLSTEMVKEDQVGLLGDKDWRVNSSLFYNHDEPSFAFSGPEKTNSVSLSGSVDKVFWGSGGRLTASYRAIKTDITISPIWGVPDSYYDNSLAVTYSLPLLKNKGGFLDRISYDLKKFDIDLSEITEHENQEDFIAAYALKYIDWVYLKEQQRIFNQRLVISEEMLANITEKREANLVDEVERIRADNSVIQTRQSLLMIKSELKGIQAELAAITADDGYLSDEPAFNLYLMADNLISKGSTDELISQLRLIKTITVKTEQLGLLNKGFTEDVKPSLDLVTQLGLKNAEERFGDAFLIDKPNVNVGLQFSLPLGQRTAHSNIIRNELQVKQLKSQLDILRRKLASSINSIRAQLSELSDVLLQNQLLIESTIKKTKEEINIYNQGRGNLTFVIQSRDSEQAARLAYSGNASLYQKLLIRYRSLIDDLYRSQER